MTHRLKLDALSATYASSATWIIDGLDLISESGAAIGIIGDNGSGKSTLAHAIVGIIPYLIPGRVRGKVDLDGMDLLDMDLQARLGLVGYTFQDVESQILFGTVRDILGFSESELPHGLLRHAMNVLGIGHLLARSPGELSGGEAQRIALLTALRRRPSVLLYDEATSALDPQARRDFHRLVDCLLEHELIVILLGQREAILAPYCEKIISVQNRRLAAGGETDPSNIPEPGVLWEEMAIVLPINATFAPQIELSAVTVKRSGNRSFVLGPVDLTIAPGEIVALLGPNGSGKTTLFLSLLGAIRALAGEFTLNDTMYSVRKWRAMPPPIAVVTQSPLSQIIGATLLEEFFIGLSLDKESQADDLQGALRRHFPFLDFNLDPLQLSFGQQRLVTILTCLLGPRPIVLVDEPEQGLDSTTLEYVKTWMKRNHRTRQKTILFSTHEIPLAAELADRCILLNRGRIIAETTISDPVFLDEWYFRNIAQDS